MTVPNSSSTTSKVKKGKEKLIVERELSNFDYKSSRAWYAITQQFSSGIRHPELLSVATILSKLTKLPEINRSSKRSFMCLVKWFDDNWNEISKVIGRVALLDESDVPISKHREIIDYVNS